MVKLSKKCYYATIPHIFQVQLAFNQRKLLIFKALVKVQLTQHWFCFSKSDSIVLPYIVLAGPTSG